MLVASCHPRVTICHPFALGTVMGTGSVHAKLKRALSLLPSAKGGAFVSGETVRFHASKQRVLKERHL